MLVEASLDELSWLRPSPFSPPSPETLPASAGTLSATLGSQLHTRKLHAPRSARKERLHPALSWSWSSANTPSRLPPARLRLERPRCSMHNFWPITPAGNAQTAKRRQGESVIAPNRPTRAHPKTKSPPAKVRGIEGTLSGA
jgi:hypothetical protein